MSKLTKRIIAGILVGVSLLMTGCDNGKVKVKEEVKQKEVKEETKTEIKEEETKNNNGNNKTITSENDIDADILANEVYEKVIINGELLPPDSIGCVYYQATLTNNLKQFVIISASVTYEYTNEEGNKDKTFLSFYDTVMPDETSPVSETFGSEDMKPVKASITLQPIGLDMEYYIDYDLKLNTWEMRHRYL